MTAQDRRALEAGLPADLLLTLIWARRLWQQQNAGEQGLADAQSLTSPLPVSWWANEPLGRAVHHPAASSFDAIFVRAMLKTFAT